MAGEAQSAAPTAAETELLPQTEPKAPPAAVVVLSERPVAERRGRPSVVPSSPVLPPPAPTPPSIPSPRAQPAPPAFALGRVAGALGALEAISRLLAVRLILLLAVAGGFALGARAADWLGFAVFTSYAVLVVGPLVWLDHSVRR